MESLSFLLEFLSTICNILSYQFPNNHNEMRDKFYYQLCFIFHFVPLQVMTNLYYALIPATTAWQRQLLNCDVCHALILPELNRICNLILAICLTCVKYVLWRFYCCGQRYYCAQISLLIESVLRSRKRRILGGKNWSLELKDLIRISRVCIAFMTYCCALFYGNQSSGF